MPSHRLALHLASACIIGLAAQEPAAAVDDFDFGAKGTGAGLVIPHHDIVRGCEKSVRSSEYVQNSRPSNSALASMVNGCVSRQQKAYDAASYYWDFLAIDSKDFCRNIKVSQSEAYTQILRCVEAKLLQDDPGARSQSRPAFRY